MSDNIPTTQDARTYLDLAIRDRLVSILPSSYNIVYASPVRAYQKITQNERSGRIDLPAISFYMLEERIDESRYNTSMAIGSGNNANLVNIYLDSTAFVDATTDILSLKFLPLNYTYQIDYWCKKRDVAHKYIRGLLWDAFTPHMHLLVSWWNTSNIKTRAVARIEGFADTSEIEYGEEDREIRGVINFTVQTMTPFSVTQLPKISEIDINFYITEEKYGQDDVDYLDYTKSLP